MGGYKLEYYLYNYLLDTKKSKNYDALVPDVIKEDIVVKFVKEYISNATCPFCFKKFANDRGVIMHLVRNTICKSLLDEFIEHTVERYLLLRSNDFKRKIKPILKQYIRRERR